MSSIIRQKVGKYSYLYEAVPFRDANGQPRYKQKPIDKINPLTGNPLYKLKYLEGMTEKGMSVEIEPTRPSFSIDDVRGSSIREYGVLLSASPHRSKDRPACITLGSDAVMLVGTFYAGLLPALIQ